MSQLNVWMTDSLTDIWQSSVQPVNALKFMELNMGKNEYECCQVAIRSTSQLTNLQVGASSLTGPGGTVITGVTARFIGTVHARANSGVIPTESKRFTAPAEVPVYFRKETSVTLPAETTIGTWITVYVPANAAVGHYSGTITVNSDQGSDTCGFAVNVYDASIPMPNDSAAFLNALSFNLCGVNPDMVSAATQNKDIYGFNNFTADFWTEVQHVAAETKLYRMNVVYVPLYYLLQPDLQFDSNGDYIFNWAKFDQFIQTFIDYGSVKLIQGSSLLCKRVDWDTPYQGWIFAGTGGSVTVDWRDPYSADYARHLDQLILSLNDHLTAKGWLAMWAQSAGDEALTPQQLDSAKYVYQSIRSSAPGMKTFDACNDQAISVFGNLLDIYIPRLEAYDYFKSSFDALKSGGSKIWYYTSSGPQDNYLQRLEDYQLASTRLLPWYSYKNEMPGYLNWGYNQWVFAAVWNDPYAELCSASDLPGDAWVVYPDVAGKTVLNGPRIAALRDGCEEFELLKIFEAKSPGAAKELANAAVVSATVHDLTPSIVLNRKLDLLLGASNVVKNGGFEDGNTGSYFGVWNAGVTTSMKHSGAYGLQISANDQGGISQFIPVKPNTNYVASAYVLTEASDKIYLSVDGYGGPSVRSADSSCASWQRVAIEFKTAALQNAVDLHIVKPTAGAGRCYVDDIDIREKPEPLVANDVTNPGFETGNANGYFGVWNAGVVTTSPHSGTYCLKIGGNAQGGISQYVQVQPNRYYTFAAYVKTSGTDTVYLSVDGYGGPSVRTADSQSGSWQFVMLEFKTAPAQTGVDIHIVKSTQGGGDCYVDDIELRERLAP